MEVVDGLGLSWGGRGFCKVFMISQHVDERRLANIRPTNKGKFGLF
jgi:hypothetical protein